jgi:hypothetical protein
VPTYGKNRIHYLFEGYSIRHSLCSGEFLPGTLLAREKFPCFLTYGIFIGYSRPPLVVFRWFHSVYVSEDAMQRDQPITLAFARENLCREAQRLREEALRAKTSNEREELLRKARQAETAAHIDDWASSTGLQPPRR